MTGPVVLAGISPCTSPLAPVCAAAGGVGSGLLGSGASYVLSDLAAWVVGGATWLLDQLGGAISSSTAIDLNASWFASHYQTMVGLSAVVVLPLLLLSVVQAVYRQSAAGLVRVVAVQLPLALVLAGAAVELVQLALAATDAMSSTVSAGSGADVQSALASVAAALGAQVAAGSIPPFVLFLGALLVAFGALMVWLELLVRDAAVYVAVLFLPLALASLVWPAISHWCRRLVDTLVALILSKFVIVAVLSLAVGAIAAGGATGFASVLSGGALLLLASFTPFTLLRLVPAVEAGAVAQLEGARRRVQQEFGGAPRSAANLALRRARESSFVAGEPGTGRHLDHGLPGTGAAGTTGGEAGGSSTGGSSTGGSSTGGSSTGGSSTGGGWAGGSSAGGGAADGERVSAGRIPMWPGQPPPDDSAVGSLPVPEREPFSLPDPAGRGPLPLWGAPVPATERGSQSPTPRPQATWRHDELGPVLVHRLSPGPSDPSAGAGAGGS